MGAWDDPEGDERLEEEERMDTVTRHTPAPRTFGPGRVLYELAGPADPTFEELSDRMRRAWSAAGRYLAWEEAQEQLPGALQTPQRPQSAVEAWEAQVAAVMAVLKRSPVVMRGEWAGAEPDEVQLRALAQECLAAADVGF